MAFRAPSLEPLAREAAISLVTPSDHWPVRLRFALPLGDDDLSLLCANNRELRIERTKEGELVILPPSGAETGRRNFELTGQLSAWVRQNGTGIGFDSSTGFKLPNGAIRSPDLAWVKRERWDTLTEDERARFAPLCPDFVLELRSPSDSIDDLRDKMAEYIECGARLGWLVDPVERAVHVYEPGHAPHVVTDADRISGDPVLSGFTLELASIWD